MPLGVDLERGPLERVAALRPDAEQRQHAPERGARAHRAEQVLAVRHGVPADHDLVGDGLRHAARDRAARPRARTPRRCPTSRARRPRRPRPRRLRRSGGRGRRPRAPRRARRAARRRRGPAACPRRRARAAARPARPTTPASRPTSRARGGRASPCATRATAPRPARRRAGARPTRRRSASARRASLSGTLSRSQRYFDDRAQRARGQARGRAEGRDLLVDPLAPRPRRASRATRSTGRRARRRAPSSTPVSAMPDTPEPDDPRVRRAVERLRAAAASAQSTNVCGSISAPVGTVRQASGAWPWAISSPSGVDHRGLARGGAEVESEQQLPALTAAARGRRGSGAPQRRSRSPLAGRGRHRIASMPASSPRPRTGSARCSPAAAGSVADLPSPAVTSTIEKLWSSVSPASTCSARK